MSRIFISYRREDSAGDAGRLADHLNRRFGAERVFLDIDTIKPGTDFERVLTSSLQQTAAMLVVIGPRWTSLAKADGSRRLDDPKDYVRREVEAALGRSIPVVPVLVQGTPLPREDELPECLVPLVKRQAATVDHAEFHDDAERLCDHLAGTIDAETAALSRTPGKWWIALGIAAALAVALALYLSMDGRGRAPAEAGVTSAAQTAIPSAVDPLMGEASEQRRRGQLLEALATLERARALAPESDAVRRMQEDVAMEWIREVRVENGTSTISDAIKPALAVIDSAIASTNGTRKADLVAHSGWAVFLRWRDGNRQLDPGDWYRDALKIDASNPYANAMLAHWMLYRDDVVDKAAPLFETALRSGRAKPAVRSLQWAAFRNTRTPETSRELVRLANAMRRDNERLDDRQRNTLWAPYYTALSPADDVTRQALFGAVPPDDHVKTLDWAFEDSFAKDEPRRQIIRYYKALLNERAGRTDEAREQLQALDKELAGHPGRTQDAVRQALRRRS